MEALSVEQHRLAAQLVEDGLAPEWVPMAEAFVSALWSFEWSRGDGQPMGEVGLEVNADGALVIVLRLLAVDNDDPERGGMLTGRVDAELDEDPRDQIRDAIHLFVTHEADEQMWFAGTRPFHPHRSGDELATGRMATPWTAHGTGHRDGEGPTVHHGPANADERDGHGERALAHARLAESLMVGVPDGCVVTPPAVAVAQVHSTLAAAYATLAGTP